MKKLLLLFAMAAIAAACTKELASQPEVDISQDRQARLEKFLKQFETKSGDFLTEEEKSFLMSDLQNVRIVRMTSVKRKNTTKSVADFFVDSCFVEYEDSLVFAADTLAEDACDTGSNPSFYGTIESGHQVHGEYDMYINYIRFDFSGPERARHSVTGTFGTGKFSADGESDSSSFTDTDGKGGPYVMNYTMTGGGRGHCTYTGSHR